LIGCTSALTSEGEESRRRRNTYHAHADRTSRRSLFNTAFGLVSARFAEGWSALRDDGLEALATLAESQRHRLGKEATKLQTQLRDRDSR